MIGTAIRGLAVTAVAVQQGGVPDGLPEAGIFGIVVAGALGTIRFGEWMLNRYVPPKNGLDGRLRRMEGLQYKTLEAIRDSARATESIATTVAAIAKQDASRDLERAELRMLVKQMHEKVAAA